MKISVICLTYGHENDIKQAIESILMQLGDFDMELIIEIWVGVFTNWKNYNSN